MSGKVVGIVVARALAIVFLVGFLSTLLNLASYFVSDSYSRLTLAYIAIYVGQCLVTFLAAGFLWRNADKFAGSDQQPTASEVLTADKALRIAVIGIATYFAFLHVNEPMNWCWEYFSHRPEGATNFLTRGYTPGGIGTFFVAVVTLVVVVKGRAIRRFYSYFSDPEEPVPPT